MIALIVLGSILLLLLILCVLPLTINFSYEHDLLFKIKYAGITLVNNEKESSHKKHSSKNIEKKAPQKKENFISKIYKQKGLLGTVRYFSDVITIILKKFFWLAKHFKIRRLKFDLIIATDDAARTAIQYGEVCAALYPLFTALQAFTNLKPKSININADFDKTKWEFKTHVLVKAKLCFWLVATIGVITQYLKLQRKECEKHE